MIERLIAGLNVLGVQRDRALSIAKSILTDSVPIDPAGRLRLYPITVKGGTKLRYSAACRRGKIDARTSRDDPGRIDGAMATVIVRLDVVEMYRFGHTGHLIKRARVIP